MSREINIIESDMPYGVARLLYESSQKQGSSSIHRIVHVEDINNNSKYIVATDTFRLSSMIVHNDIVQRWGLSSGDYKWVAAPIDGGSDAGRSLLKPIVLEEPFPDFKRLIKQIVKTGKIGIFRRGTIQHKLESIAPISLDLRKLPRFPKDLPWEMFSTKDSKKGTDNCVIFEAKNDDANRSYYFNITYVLMGLVREFSKEEVVIASDLV